MDSMDSLVPLLACPICGSAFARRQAALVCANAHAFDIAREGYINLLRKKLPGVPGDTKEMLLARRNFFDLDYYQPISHTINELVQAYAPTPRSGRTEHSPDLIILDAGCGEGYYAGHLHSYLMDRGRQSLSLGIDISKEAIRLAAKRYSGSGSRFLVGNLRERLVLQDAVIHVLLNIFAPRNPEEYARILVPGGLLLVVIPGPAHLHQLRSQLHLLGIEESKREHVIAQFAPSFSLLTTSTLTYTIRVRRPAISWLVMMTPNYWHLSPQSHAALEQLEEIQTTIEATCLLFKQGWPLPAQNH